MGHHGRHLQARQQFARRVGHARKHEKGHGAHGRTPEFRRGPVPIGPQTGMKGQAGLTCGWCVDVGR